MIEETTMNATMVQIEPTYTRDEQNTALVQIIADNGTVPQRRLARAVWNKANNRYALEPADLLSLQESFTSDSFRRNSHMLVRVPLATIYNRIRRITGRIK